ncbi:MAG: hypothetical protein ACKO96_24875, partial [Flammeovirgaceae bacterium]
PKTPKPQTLFAPIIMIGIIPSRIVAFLVLISVETVHSLQFFMSGSEPVCISFKPKSLTQGLTVNYLVTGTGENMVTFTASQDGR